MKKVILLCLTAFVSLWLAASTADATTFTLSVNAVGSGSVGRNPTNSNGVYPAGVNVTLTAISNNPSWYFSGWSGDATGSDNPLNVGMDSNKVVTATFQQLPSYTLTLATNGQGGISLNPPGGVYLSNSVVTVTASSPTGWVFTAWSGGASGSANPLFITMNTNNSVTGTFAQLPAFDIEPQGVTNVSGSTVSFTSHAVGAAPLGYQWFFSGGSLTHATNTTLVSLTLTNVQSANAGTYWIIANNNYGWATSSVVALVITNFIGTTNVVNSPDEASLRAAINIGGWVSLAFNGTVTLANTINITNNVILDAQNVSATISGGNAVRLFYVAPGASLSATNLTLANGSCIVIHGPTGTPADAGAVYNDGGIVTLVTCTLANNSAQSQFNGGGGLARGGAIFNNGGIVQIFGSSLSNNAVIAVNNNYQGSTGALGYGGAIFSTNGSVVIMNSVLSSNLCTATAGANGACFGGALFLASGSSAITNSVFAMNSALGGNGSSGIFGAPPIPAYGGAAGYTGGSVAIDHSQFVGNTAKGGDAGYHSSEAPGSGGAIYSACMLSSESTVFSGNQALSGNYAYPYATSADGSGGGIYNLGTAFLNRCSVFSNYVQGGAAVAYLSMPGNGASGLGGGIFNALQLNATNCTIALNSAVAGSGSPAGIGSPGLNGSALGGGIFNSTSATSIFVCVTVASNYCVANGASLAGTNGFAAGTQIANTNGTLRLHNTIIAYGGASGNAFGPITDDGFNISSDGSANLFGSSTSYNYTDPKLSPLDYSTGPTLCMALLANSPAIDFGDSSGAPSTDQRGYLRPNGDGVDIGAFEFYSPYQAGITRLTATASASGIGLNFMLSPASTCRIQASSNLVSWFDLETNGPFASATNMSRTFGTQGFDHRFFRLLLQ